MPFIQFAIHILSLNPVLLELENLMFKELSIVCTRMKLDSMNAEVLTKQDEI